MIMKSLKYLLIFLSLVIAPVLFTGCVTGGGHPTDDPASPTGDSVNDRNFKIVTKIITSELIDGDKELAADIDSGIAEVVKAIETGVLVTPEQVDDFIADLIKDTDLQPTTKQQLYTLATAIREQYLGHIDAGVLDPNITAPLVTVLKWVQEAAQDTIKFGAGVDYGTPQPIFTEYDPYDYEIKPLVGSSSEAPGGLFYFITGARDWDSLVAWWQTPATNTEVNDVITQRAQLQIGHPQVEFDDTPYMMWAYKHGLGEKAPGPYVR